MRSTQPRVLSRFRKSALALCASAGMAAFAGSADSDPIIGGYDGTAYFNVNVVVTVPGGGSVLQQIPEIANLTMDLSTGNAASVDGLFGASTILPGAWKRNGTKYLADFSAAATADLKNAVADPQAKATAKYKKIVRNPAVGIGGKVLVKRTIHDGTLLVHQDDKGVFSCVPAVHG